MLPKPPAGKERLFGEYVLTPCCPLSTLSLSLWAGPEEEEELSVEAGSSRQLMSGTLSDRSAKERRLDDVSAAGLGASSSSSSPPWKLAKFGVDAYMARREDDSRPFPSRFFTGPSLLPA